MLKLAYLSFQYYDSGIIIIIIETMEADQYYILYYHIKSIVKPPAKTGAIVPLKRPRSIKL